jgi:hypothetical protein
MSETDTQSEQINIGSAFLNDIYAEPKLINENPQPFYIVHKDTCKTFLYEMKDKFSLFDRFLAVIGVEFTLIITLVTATFSDFQIIKGDTIRGVFISFALLVGLYLLYLGFKNIANINKMSVNKLCDDLGKLSTIIEP